jgi:hypothetical protein
MGSPKSQISMVIAAVVALVFPAAAVAATPPPPPPPDTPSISQYVEQVPTSRGGWSLGVGKAHARALPPKVSNRLRAHRDPVSQQLEKVATSSGYGAPQRTLPKAAGGNAAPKASNALSAAVSAVSDSGDSHVVWLLLALVFVTTAMVWSAARLRAR